MLLAHLLHFFLGAIFRGIGHGVAAIAIGLHLQDVGTLARTRPFQRLGASGHHGAHIHAIHLLAGDVEGDAALREVLLGRGPRDGGAHGVAVVLDDVDGGQLPQLRHVEALVDLALIGRAVAEIDRRDRAIVAVMIGEGEASAQRHLPAHDAVAAIEMLLFREHVHGAALAPRQAAATTRQFGHDALGVHAAGQHVAMVAIAGDDLIALLEGHLHADHHGFLADVEMAEAADEAHAVKLPRLLFEAADQQHVALMLEKGARQ